MTASGLKAERKRRAGLQFIKRFLRMWKGLKRWIAVLKQHKKRAKAEAERLRSEGTVEKLMHETGYLAEGSKLTLAAMADFIRVHKTELAQLDRELWKLKKNSKTLATEYLRDVLEGELEPADGWTRKVRPLAAIMDARAAAAAPATTATTA